MELCTITTTTTTTIPHLLPSSTNQNHGIQAGNNRISFPPLHRNISSRIGVLRCTGKFPGETVSEDVTNGVNEFGVVEKKKDITIEEKSLNGEEAQTETSSGEEEEEEEDIQTQTLEFLNDIKIDSDNTYTILLYGSGAIVALYLTSAIVGSLESIPLFPKLMEVVGLGYTLWFTTRYLLFKKNREELKTKISEIKKQVLGSDNE